MKKKTRNKLLISPSKNNAPENAMLTKIIFKTKLTEHKTIYPQKVHS